MVPEQRTRTVCYKVCHMVPEQQDLLLQGLPHGARAADPHGVLHGLQASVLPTDDPGLQVCAAVCALHGHPLRAALRLQASAGNGLLPEQLLRQWLRQRLRRRLRRRLRLQQLACSVGLLPVWGARLVKSETHSGPAQMSRPAFFVGRCSRLSLRRQSLLRSTYANTALGAQDRLASASSSVVRIQWLHEPAVDAIWADAEMSVSSGSRARDGEQLEIRDSRDSCESRRSSCGHRIAACGCRAARRRAIFRSAEPWPASRRRPYRRRNLRPASSRPTARARCHYLRRRVPDDVTSARVRSILAGAGCFEFVLDCFELVKDFEDRGFSVGHVACFDISMQQVKSKCGRVQPVSHVVSQLCGCSHCRTPET